jgi:hypothetical protein
MAGLRFHDSRGTRYPRKPRHARAVGHDSGDEAQERLETWEQPEQTPNSLVPAAEEGGLVSSPTVKLTASGPGFRLWVLQVLTIFALPAFLW